MHRPALLRIALVVTLSLACVTRAQSPKPERIGFLLSGHSLTDEPLGAMIRDIAVSRGHVAAYQHQNIVGSPLSARTIGHRQNPRDPARFPWTGYTSGRDLNGNPFDLVRELRRPAALGGQTYTHVIVAERHDSFGPLQWEQTVPTLRHFYELAREGSPAVRGYFYTTWLDVEGVGSSKDDPRGWVTLEREQLRLWESITSRINDSLANENRADRMITLPASGALAELVERATTGKVEGVTGSSVRETMDRLFTDNVHQTTLGRYYIACVTYAAITGRSPVGAAHPTDVSPTAARSLQTIAREYVSDYYKDRPTGPHHAFDERAAIARSFATTFWTYLKRPEQARGTAEFFSRRTLENPLWTAPGVDESSFWLPRLP